MVWLNSVAVLVASLSSGGAAPRDVPKGHWAHQAVEELFQAGLMDGYAVDSHPLKFDPSTAIDLKFTLEVMKRFKAAGMLVGFPDGLSGRPMVGDYDLAIKTHNAMEVVFANRWEYDMTSVQPVLANLHDLAKLISVRIKVLKELGANPTQMIRDLETFRARFDPATLFRG